MMTDRDLTQMDTPQSDMDPPDPVILPNVSQNDSTINNTGDPLSGDTVVLIQNSNTTRWRNYLSVVVLFLVNLLNYMDRFTVAAVLTKIQTYYGLGDSSAGVLQTAFICSYMICAPLFGYLGDRYNRKIIIIFGIVFWLVTVLASSYVPSHMFGVFLLLRALVGVGEASYSNIAPTLIADMFSKDDRSKMLMVFYFAIPFGSGLGFVVGSQVANYFDDWKMGVRLTPILGVLLVMLVILIIREPQRGESEGSGLRTSSWGDDILHIAKTPTYISTTFGATCVAFVAGSLSWWAPTLILYGNRSKGYITTGAQSSLIFGVITAFAGLTGVALGSLTAQRWRRSYAAADPVVCGLGLLVSVPFGYVALNLIRVSMAAVWPLMFVAITALSLNWSIVNDIVMYVVVPTRRATAVAFQTLIQHLLGDAISPYVIGAVSDRLRGIKTTALSHYDSLEYAMFLQFFVMILGAAFFLTAGFFVEKDKLKAQMEIMEESNRALPEPEEENGPEIGYSLHI